MAEEITSIPVAPTQEAVAEAKVVLTPATEPTQEAVAEAKVLLETPTPEAVAEAKVLLEPTVPTAEEVARAKAILSSVGELPPADQRVLSTTWDYAACASLVAARAVSVFWRVLNGFKTIFFFGLTGILTMLEAFAGVDVSGFVVRLLPAGWNLSMSDVVVLISIAGILLRLVSNGPAFSRWRNQEGDVSGAVDVPAEGR